ncbi:MAG: DinB family protein [Nocardioidaceae bacterium]
MDPETITDEVNWARADFRRLLDGATSAELLKPSHGTKWTNEQLLFHMLFGYLVVRTLLPLVKAFARLPSGVSRRFARVLNAATRPFHVVNYLGSLGGARVLGHAGMERVMDRVTEGLIGSVSTAGQKQLQRGMHFPVDWDPYFRDFMTVADVLHYATQHYEHHRKQLTLSDAVAD